ncbi:MAG: hypothetical protein ACI4I6_07930 [Hominimerdicola sp.]
MSHTLLEQSKELDGETSCVDTIVDLFVHFGYTQDGDYYYSPVDSNFGVRCYVDDDLSYTNICATFDGGNTEINVAQILNLVYNSVRYYPYKILYHVSKSENVICLRFMYKVSSTINTIGTLLIAHDAHDEKYGTVCFVGSFEKSTSNITSNGMHKFYMIDYRKIKIQMDNNLLNSSLSDAAKVSKYFANTIYRYPSHANISKLIELYGIISLQEYDYTYLPSYINYNGTIYRIVSMSNGVPNDATTNYPKNTFMPHFAFPVSD